MKKITPYFIIGLVVTITVFDFAIIDYQGKGESISATLIRWAYSYPSIPFLLGFVCGHLFWKMRDDDIWFKGKK